MPDTILHPHQPATLLPLLRKHLPASIRVYGVLTSNDNNTLPYPAYTTFTPSQLKLNTIPKIWVIIITLPSPLTDQIRIYCSLDLSCHQDDLGDTGPRTRAEGQKLVESSLEAYKAVSKEFRKVGAIDRLWTDGLRRSWGLEKKPTYWYWLSPVRVEAGSEVEAEVEIKVEVDRGGHDGHVSGGRIGDEQRAKRAGLIVDVGREIDVEIIQSTCDIYRPAEYYRSRLSHTTVIRPMSSSTSTSSSISSSNGVDSNSDSEASSSSIPTTGQEDIVNQAVCWIVTHTDGAQGALYTMPNYRRRGLAKWVTEERLKKVREGDKDARGFVCVAEGNEGSEGLWNGMGWVRGWSVEWVY